MLLARHEPRRRLRWWFLGLAATLALLVGGSRVALGVHYPSDVVAGWLVGVGWAAAWRLIEASFDDSPGHGAS